MVLYRGESAGGRPRQGQTGELVPCSGWGKKETVRRGGGWQGKDREAHRIECLYSAIWPSANAAKRTFISERLIIWKIRCSFMTSSLKACEVSCDAITASESCHSGKR